MKINKSRFINKKGITLIALVVTVIVLIILAGVSLNVVYPNTGLFGRVTDASEEYNKTIIREQDRLSNLDEELYGNKVEDVGDTIVGNIRYINDGEGNIIPAPAEFYYVGGTKDTGFVISDVEGDDLDNSLGGNQFVWIPVNDIGQYTRVDYSKRLPMNAVYQAMPADEKISIEKYKGYYIGRFEAGDAESTQSKTLRTSSTTDDNTVTVKKGQAPYNFVTRTQAKALAEGMAEKEGYTAETKLLSSYAWDTAISFIQNIDSDYGLSSIEGNYKNTPSFTYTDLSGATQTKLDNTKTLMPTGQTTALNNIYDLGGNVFEWTSECCYYNGYPYVFRGGSCDYSYVDYSAGMREPRRYRRKL